MILGIYMIKNKINGKVYIGSSASKRGIKGRFSIHKRDLKNEKHHSDHLQKAWNKYGEDSFEFIIIEDLTSEINNIKEISQRKEIILSREQYYIEKYKSYDDEFGYNMSPTAGSRLGIKLTKETKIKLSKIRLGTKQSEEQKIKHSIAMTGENNPMFGKIFTDEHKRKIGIKSKNRKFSEESRNKIRIKNQGEKSSTAKINEFIVIEIKLMLLDGFAIKDIMNKLDVTYNIVDNIKNGKTWRHITVDDFEKIINRQKQKVTNDILLKIKELLLDNKTHREIAELTKAHPRTISKVSKLMQVGEI